jgi:hypothetical protein
MQLDALSEHATGPRASIAPPPLLLLLPADARGLAAPLSSHTHRQLHPCAPAPLTRLSPRATACWSRLGSRRRRQRAASCCQSPRRSGRRQVRCVEAACGQRAARGQRTHDPHPDPPHRALPLLRACLHTHTHTHTHVQATSCRWATAGCRTASCASSTSRRGRRCAARAAVACAAWRLCLHAGWRGAAARNSGTRLQARPHAYTTCSTRAHTHVCTHRHPPGAVQQVWVHVHRSQAGGGGVHPHPRG